jgi:hypothetical protein
MPDSIAKRLSSLPGSAVASRNVVGLSQDGLMPSSSFANELSSLPQLNKPALTELWRKIFTADPPLRMRKELMLQFVAYRMQEQEFGALSNRSHHRLRELAKAIEVNSSRPVSRRPAIKSGTRLIRQWKDEVHIVNVEEGNYEYRGARYESLSEIARLITGTRWSGPLFFGLKSSQKAPAAK